MAKIREKDRNSVLNAIAGGVTPRQGIQFIQVGRKRETEAILNDLQQAKDGGGSVRIINASFGSGKRVDMRTPVLAEGGWKRIRDIKEGERVYTRIGTLATVTGIYDGKEKAYELKLIDGRSVRCCGKHLWIVVSSHSNKEQTLTTREIESRISNRDADEDFLSIPLNQAVSFPNRDLPLHPYALGAIIGHYEKSLDKSHLLSLPYDFDRDVINHVAECMQSIPFRYRTETGEHWCFVDTSNYQTLSLKALDKIKHSYTSLRDDFIDESYLNAGIEQRWQLLQGLMDTKGTIICKQGGHDCKVTYRIPTFVTDSRKLSTQVLYLARSLGLFALTYHYDDLASHKKPTMMHAVEIYTTDTRIFKCSKHNKIGMESNDWSEHPLYLKSAGFTAMPIDSVRPLGFTSAMRCLSVDDDTHSYILEDFTVTHNTFMLTLSKTVALKQNFMVITADLSPDRRLYSSSGQAENLYREEIRSLSTPLHPDGGALEEVLDAIDMKIMRDDQNDATIKEFVDSIRTLPYGFDAITVLNKWHIANHPITDKEKRDSFILKDACLRWFSSESTREGKKLLGVRSTIGDDGAWDALKLIAMLGKYAGYSGLLVELDECVNLYKINNSTSRDRNYEQILRIFNECLQGDAKYVCVIFSGTPEFVMDTRRGLYSYDALRSRLIGSDYKPSDDVDVDVSGPVIDLKPLSQEDLLVLLRNITNVEAMGDKSQWLVTDDDMEAFLKKQYDTLGADYYKTPRELLRSWAMLLRTLRGNPETNVQDLIRSTEVKQERKKSGLGEKMDSLKPSNTFIESLMSNNEEESEFGF